MRALTISAEPRPFLKWVGGKRQLLKNLRRRVPKTFGTYFEPFVGGGALYFALRPRAAILSDSNSRLIRTYLAVRDDVEGVIRHLREMQRAHSRTYFENMRAWPIDADENVMVAAWFIYLNRTAYNGLYRVNRSGLFNAPFGDYRAPRICDEQNLRACSRQLQGATILHAPFQDALENASEGDFSYFDPPYVPLSRTSSFRSYTSNGFTMADQTDLRDLAIKLHERRINVLLSNSNTRAVRELYRDNFRLTRVDATRSINSDTTRRGAVRELLIVPK